MLTSSTNNHTVSKFRKRNTNYFTSPLLFPWNKSHQYLPNKRIPLSTLSLVKQVHYEHDPQPLTTLNTRIPINRPFLGKPNNVKVSISLESVTIQFQYVRRGFNKGEGVPPSRQLSFLAPSVDRISNRISIHVTGGRRWNGKEPRGKIGFSGGQMDIDRSTGVQRGRRGGRGWKTNGCAYVNVCYVRQGVAEPEAGEFVRFRPNDKLPQLRLVILTRRFRACIRVSSRASCLLSFSYSS